MEQVECEDCGWVGHRDMCPHEIDGKDATIIDGFTVLEDTYAEVCPRCHSRNLVPLGETEESKRVKE